MSAFDEIVKKVGSDEVYFEVAMSVYSISAILKASYVFIDRCYIYLNKESNERVTIYLKAKTLTTEPKSLAGEFMNQLLNQRLQEIVDKETGKIRELLVAQSFSDAQLVASGEKSEKPFGYKGDPLDVGRLQGLGKSDELPGQKNV